MSHLDPGNRESAGIARANVVSRPSGIRLLVSSLSPATADDYVSRGPAEAVLTPAFVAREVAKARRDQQAVIFYHTHPFSERAKFSAQDDRGETELYEFLTRRLPGLPHVAIVIGKRDHSARLLGTSSDCPFDVIGRDIRRFTSSSDGRNPPADRDDRQQAYDRQIRLFGKAAQNRLAQLNVGIVGLGGTGSFIAQELAHLGVENFVLMDSDTMDVSNLNRTIGAEPSDVTGSLKINVAARLIRRIRPGAKVVTLYESVLEQKSAMELTAVDVILACTDTHGSRYVLNQLAYQFLIPVIDVGVAIATSQGLLSHVFGRTQMLAPSLPCLTCLKTLDPEHIRRDMMSDFERRADPYVIGDVEPQPAVVSLNGTTASLAVTMLLAAFTGLPLGARYQLYDAIHGFVRPLVGQVTPNCVTCSFEGALARGDSWPVPGRTE